MLNRAVRCLPLEFGIWGRNMVKAVIARDTTVVEVSICKQRKRLRNNGVSRSWYRWGGPKRKKSQSSVRIDWRYSFLMKYLSIEVRNSYVCISWWETMAEKVWRVQTLGRLFPKAIRTCLICCSRKFAAVSAPEEAVLDVLSHISMSFSDNIAEVWGASDPSSSSELWTRISWSIPLVSSTKPRSSPRWGSTGKTSASHHCRNRTGPFIAGLSCRRRAMKKAYFLGWSLTSCWYMFISSSCSFCDSLSSIGERLSR